MSTNVKCAIINIYLLQSSKLLYIALNERVTQIFYFCMETCGYTLLALCSDIEYYCCLQRLPFFQPKILIFFVSMKNILWVLVRSAEALRMSTIPRTCFCGNKKKNMWTPPSQPPYLELLSTWNMFSCARK